MRGPDSARLSGDSAGKSSDGNDAHTPPIDYTCPHVANDFEVAEYEGPNMRRVIVVAVAILGAVVIFAGAILFYAATNLNSIIAERRQIILDKVSTALGRQVHADDIKVSLGWGILADVTGVQVADDPDISKKPFIEASNVYARLQLIPLLARRIEVTEVLLDKPVIRIVQTRDGSLNVSTLGRKKVKHEQAPG
ncbi:MAG: hypothetical protein WBQ86_18745, partial [Candidatus Binatus sp.]